MNDTETMLTTEQKLAIVLEQLKRTRGWIGQYLDLPGHRDAAQIKLKAIDAAIEKAELR